MAQRRPDDPELDSGWQPPEVSLDPSGRVTGRAPEPSPEPLPAGPAPDDPLELAVDPEQVHAEAAAASSPDVAGGYEPLPNSYAAPKRSGSPRFLRVLLWAFALLVAAAAGAVVLTHLDLLKRALPAARSGPAILRVDSEPSGATVWINGREAGQTPYAQDNDFPQGAGIPVKLTLRGHRPWTGSFQGGAEAAVKARLERK